MLMSRACFELSVSPDSGIGYHELSCFAMVVPPKHRILLTMST